MSGLLIRSLRSLSDISYKREILHYTDDEQEAFDLAAPYWIAGAKNVTVAKVSQMLNPPRTAYKYVVLRITKV